MNKKKEEGRTTSLELPEGLPKIAVGAKEAAHTAAEFLTEMIGRVPQDLLVEEIELEGSEWLVTLGFSRKNAMGATVFFGPDERVYKIVAVDAKTGAAKSIKIRKV